MDKRKRSFLWDQILKGAQVLNSQALLLKVLKMRPTFYQQMKRRRTKIKVLTSSGKAALVSIPMSSDLHLTSICK